MAKKRKVSTKSALRLKKDNNLLILCLVTTIMVASYLLFKGTTGNIQDLRGSSYIPSTKIPVSNVVELIEQNNSGEYGNAVLTESNGKTHVHVEIKNTPRGVSQPAHIHVGTCIDLGAVKYPLTNLVNGFSDTVINVSLADLSKQGSLALNVHQSIANSGRYVSCGNLNF